MTKQAHPEDVQQLVRLLARGDVAGLAREAGVDPSSIYRYLAGTALPRPATLRKLVAGAGLSMRFVETLLLPAVRAARHARMPLSESFLDDFEAAAEELGSELGAAALIQLSLLLSRLEDSPEWWERSDLSPEEESRRAAGLRSRLEPCSPEDRRFLVETCPELQGRLS